MHFLERKCMSFRYDFTDVPINYIPALVQIMAWRRPGDKPLSEPMLLILLMDICVTRHQWVNSRRPGDAYICISELSHYWIRQWLATCLVPTHYLNQWWHIDNWTLRNIFQWNVIWNLKVFIQENASENVICEMAAILSLAQCVMTA